MIDYSKASEVRTENVEGHEIIVFPTNGHQPEIEWEYPEFQCLCPVSSRHDQGIVLIIYLPDKNILESKSVREYLSLWRNKHIWQEYVTEEIAETLYRACTPKWLILEIEWVPRGGIAARTISKKGDIDK